MYHLLWVIVHIIAFILLPDFGASISLLFYMCIELLLKIRKNLKFEFIHLFYLGSIITVLANINVISSFKSGDYIDSYSYAVPSLFPTASLVLALGVQFLSFGYFWNTKISLPKIKLRLRLKKGTMDIIFFIGLIFTFKRFWLFLNLPGSFQTLIELIPLVSIFVLSRYAGKFQLNFLFYRGIFITLLVSLNALLFSYLRIEILLPIVVFVLGYFLGSNSIRPLLSIKFIPIVIFGLIFYSFFEIFGEKRESITTGFDRISQLLGAYSEEQIYLNESDQGLSAFERSSNISQISAVCDLVENYGVYSGKATAPLLLAFIPRALWPEKPKIALGVWFALEIGLAVEIDGWYNNSINMTIPGNLFLDFGWFGLFIGSFIVGMFIRLLWDSISFYSHNFNLLGTFFGVYLLFTSFTGIGADLQIFVTYLAIYIILLSMSKFINIKNENSLYRAHS